MKVILEKVVTRSIAATQKIARKLAGQLPRGSWVGLFGDLGSGKTTFMQGFAQGLGIKAYIQSPTFVIIKEYEISQKAAPGRLVHIDLYRLAAGDLQTLGLEDYMNGGCTVAVEWAEKLPENFKNKLFPVYFKTVGEGAREICYPKKI